MLNLSNLANVAPGNDGDPQQEEEGAAHQRVLGLEADLAPHQPGPPRPQPPELGAGEGGEGEESCSQPTAGQQQTRAWPGPPCTSVYRERHSVESTWEQKPAVSDEVGGEEGEGGEVGG